MKRAALYGTVVVEVVQQEDHVDNRRITVSCNVKVLVRTSVLFAKLGLHYYILWLCYLYNCIYRLQIVNLFLRYG